MKNAIKIYKLLIFILTFFTIQSSVAQWTQTSLSNGDALYLLPSGSGGTTSAIGVGAFNGSNPSAYFHINSNLQPATNTGFNAGQVFRTSGPSGVDHQWRMFSDNNSSNTEKFNITNPSGTDNVELKSITGPMKFYTDGTQRMCITPGSSSGFIGIGAAFNAPKSKVHMHQGGGSDIQFQMTTANTGSSNATDGLGIKITDSDMNAEFKQYENADMLFYTNASERVRIKNDGSVGIGTASPSVNTKMHLYYLAPTGTGSTINGSRIELDANGANNTINGLYVTMVNPASGGSKRGVLSELTATDCNIIGCEANVVGSKAGTNPTTSNVGGLFTASVGNANGSAINYGVYAGGVNAKNDNYGVYGTASGGTNNYAIYGEMGGGSTQWAGYFNGGTFGTVAFTSSDANLKTNVQDLTDGLAVINQLSPKTFEYKTQQQLNSNLNLPTGNHAGVIAQDLEQVLPDLVSSVTQPAKYDDAGNQVYPALTFKGVNYIELIPYLIQAIKQQQAQIDALSSPNAPGGNEQQRSDSYRMNIKLENEEGSILYQNQPNPFKGSTKINYFIPEGTGRAVISFYNSKGNLMKEVEITQKGQCTLEVNAEDLSVDIYTYSLTVDGKLIDTKKMVRTK